MTEPPCYSRIDPSGTATITLNRPKVHNALDEAIVSALIDSLNELDRDPSVRAVILASSNKTFCAGVDLKWMQHSAQQSYAENLQDALNLAELMRTLHNLSKPTIALVGGAAYGGGVGLVACCDIAIASERARFCFSEVRLGLIPSVINPYVVRAIGERAARRYCLTAEIFRAEEAHHIGLVHEVVSDDKLAAKSTVMTGALMAGGPAALSATKKLVNDSHTVSLDNAVLQSTAEQIATVRSSEEAKEGVGAFLEKRQPAWLR